MIFTELETYLEEKVKNKIWINKYVSDFQKYIANIANLRIRIMFAIK